MLIELDLIVSILCNLVFMLLNILLIYWYTVHIYPMLSGPSPPLSLRLIPLDPLDVDTPSTY